DDKPFALFLSTIGTHLPNGIYDKRMEAFISPKKSSLEFMVAAVDYLLGDFIGFLEKNGYLENTVFYIYPDHLIMGNTPSVLQDFGTLRDLYLITNASSEKLPYPSTQKIWQVNIPKVILDGAEVQHRMPFFCDYIPEEERVYDFINKHKKEIVAFNEAAIRTVRFDEGIDIYLKGEKGFLIKNDKGSTEHFELQPQKGNALLLSIDQRGRIMDNKTVEDFYFFHTKRYHSQEIQLFIQRKTDGLYACLRKGDKLAVAKMGEEHISFDKSDFEVLRKWSFDDAAYRLPPSPNYHQPYDFIEITSGKGGKAEINLPGQIIIGTQSFPLQKGINLLRCEGDECEVQHFAITEKAALPPQFLSAIKDLKQKRQFFAVVTQEWSADWSVYQKDLEAVGLPALSRIKPKQCYVAYAYKGYITEMKQWTPLSLRLPLHPRKPLRSMREIDADAYNAQKLIAHAGGAIDGITYTNSLDALQRNYAKGFRLFELDIIKTTDGHYVAAHDWNYWAKHCGRSDRKLVDKATFLQHKIDGAYSLLDMERINAWFSAHPDAILITDKVNEPKDFADRFVDKSRLMMELFSVEAVEEAIREGIKVIPSEKVLSEIKGDKIEWLQKRGIGQVALSRLKFREQLPFIKDLKAAGIKVYLYHVNAEKGKDESYVLLHEMDYAWGMYVDF
ncbi:MAG TPA: hypothetical protein ENJ45_05845, partial [Phaeodactylibacter sp.]|nr:hypothetical protein [Phaeodactylibacter sp.]